MTKEEVMAAFEVIERAKKRACEIAEEMDLNGVYAVDADPDTGVSIWDHSDDGHLIEWRFIFDPDWKAKWQAEIAEKQRQIAERHKELDGKREQEERTLYERLKAKYGASA